ncbi:dihydrodipicolinate synthase family protein [Paenibacillus xerothermodurans]|uniref:Dihydrodipicolinate synthase family protein n=1 Tax=Paenibacillus xerothermodurans TaxID=1977292 RepID=A0A2W1NBU7_PAEXE|nr:dihydrodipicolinate synthase family protein [Paenibacillus xerothermodurans]PZE21414.1 dihydrodipicolinate synthase family protein [Paenibacillus xerothermodurans]
MNYAEFGKKFETICAISMTPFYPDTKEINWDGVEENINFLIEHGTKVIVPCGNTSEFYALTLDEAKEEIRRVVEIVAGRALVLAGIGYAVPTAIELGKCAQQAGADAVMIHQPIHPYVTTTGAITYFKNIIEALDIPSVIYWKDANLSDDVLRVLAPLDKFVAVKYAINDLPRFTKIVRDMPAEHNITWVCGTAEKWAPYYFNAGAKGFTSGLINLCPQISFEMLHALQADDQETVWRAWEKALPFENLRAKYNNGNNVVAVKEAMNQIGLTAGVTREPVDPLNDKDRAEVTKILTSWGLLQHQQA